MMSRRTLSLLVTLILFPLLSTGCPWGAVEEPLSRAEWSMLATQSEDLFEHIYQHNQTDLEFLNQAATTAFGSDFLAAKSWDEVSRTFRSNWSNGKQDWIEEYRRLNKAYEEHSALISVAAIFQSRATLDEVKSFAHFGSGPDFNARLDSQDDFVDQGGQETQSAVNDRLKNAGPRDGWPIFSAIDDLAGPVSLGRDIGLGTLILARELSDRDAPLRQLLPLMALFESHPFSNDGFSPSFWNGNNLVENPLYEGVALENDPFAPANIESIKVVAERIIQTAEALSKGELAEGMLSLNFQFLALQNAVQNESRRFQTLSNVSKARHDATMNSIRNMK